MNHTIIINFITGEFIKITSYEWSDMSHDSDTVTVYLKECIKYIFPLRNIVSIALVEETEEKGEEDGRC